MTSCQVGEAKQRFVGQLELCFIRNDTVDLSLLAVGSQEVREDVLVGGGDLVCDHLILVNVCQHGEQCQWLQLQVGIVARHRLDYQVVYIKQVVS